MQRSIDGADSISGVLAWRINRHLADATAPATRTTTAETRTWNTLAWTLKAAENTGGDARTLLADAAGMDLNGIHYDVQRLALAAAKTSADVNDLPPWITTLTHAAVTEPRHSDYLRASADLIADRFTALGEQTAGNRPDWSADLGHAPEDGPPARSGIASSPSSLPTATTTTSTTTTPRSPPAPTSRPAAPDTTPTGTQPLPRSSPGESVTRPADLWTAWPLRIALLGTRSASTSTARCRRTSRAPS